MKQQVIRKHRNTKTIPLFVKIITQDVLYKDEIVPFQSMKDWLIFLQLLKPDITDPELITQDTPTVII